MHFVQGWYFLRKRRVTEGSGANDEVVATGDPQIDSNFAPELGGRIEVKYELHWLLFHIEVVLYQKIGVYIYLWDSCIQMKLQ